MGLICLIKSFTLSSLIAKSDCSSSILSQACSAILFETSTFISNHLICSATSFEQLYSFPFILIFCAIFMLNLLRFVLHFRRKKVKKQNLFTPQTYNILFKLTNVLINL